MLMQIVCCTLVTGGIILFGWCVLGGFLLPVKGANLITEYRVRESCDNLEQTVRGLIWLHETGLMEIPLRIVDCGLSEEGQEVVARLAMKHPYIEIIKEQSS